MYALYFSKVTVRANWHGSATPTVLAIGNFDGVHTGHQQLLKSVIAEARPDEVKTVMTFEPHPLAILDPVREPPRLIDLRTKVKLLTQAGIDCVNVMRFSTAFARLSATNFIERVQKTFSLRSLVVGNDFRFGHARVGDIVLLRELAAQLGFELVVVPDWREGQKRVSSKLVRTVIRNGDFELAHKLLGRRYSLAGRVQHGRKLGHQLGYPTANIRFTGKPSLDGIYASYAFLDNRRWPAALSVGTRPAVNDGTNISIEAHLIGFTGNAYGKRLTLEPVERLRSEQNYADLAQLRQAIGEDVAQCVRLLGPSHSCPASSSSKP